MRLRHFPVLCGCAALLATGCSGSSGPARLGCHQYCLNAGGYGGGPSGKAMAAVLASHVSVSKDGIASIPIRCDYHATCTGALLIDNGGSGSNPCQSVPAVPGARTPGWWAQSDLSVPAGAKRTIGLELSSCARRLLSQQHSLNAAVIVDTLREETVAERTQWNGLVGVAITLSSP